MQNPLEKFILDHKLTCKAEFSNDIVFNYKGISNIQERFKYELIHSLGKELANVKSLDIQVHEKPFSVVYELELFVFNKEELKKLIMEIEKHNIMNTLVTSIENTLKK